MTPHLTPEKILQTGLAFWAGGIAAWSLQPWGWMLGHILAILGLPESDYGRMLMLTQEMFGAADEEKFDRVMAAAGGGAP